VDGVVVVGMEKL